MKTTYEAPHTYAIRIAHESICVGSGENGDINNVSIKTDGDAISSGSDFGVKGNAVQWDDWDE